MYLKFSEPLPKTHLFLFGPISLLFPTCGDKWFGLSWIVNFMHFSINEIRSC